MGNRFKNPEMRKVYAVLANEYRTKGTLFYGSNSWRSMFLRGLRGDNRLTWSAADKNTYDYAAFRAGQDCAKVQP